MSRTKSVMKVEQETAAYVMAPRAPQASTFKPATAATSAPPKVSFSIITTDVTTYQWPLSCI